jgi:hypothetical protein
LSCGALEVVAELTFEDKVDALNLLFFAQLLTVAHERLAPAHGVAVLSRRLRAALFNRARRLVATITLEK